MKRLFSRDVDTGITKYWHVTGKGEYVVETVQDTQHIAESNKRAYNNVDGKFGAFSVLSAQEPRHCG